MDKLLYGVAYYDEYMPYERLQKDMEMMKAANINVIRRSEENLAEKIDELFEAAVNTVETIVVK